MTLHVKGSAAAAPRAVPESAGEDAAGNTPYALRVERDLVLAWAAAVVAAEQLVHLAADAAPEDVARSAERMERAAGLLWMRARRVSEARGTT